MMLKMLLRTLSVNSMPPQKEDVQKDKSLHQLERKRENTFLSSFLFFSIVYDSISFHLLKLTHETVVLTNDENSFNFLSLHNSLRRREVCFLLIRFDFLLQLLGWLVI